MSDFALAVQMKRKKKMAKGGSVKSEALPMPDQKGNDAKSVSANSGKKPLSESQWTDSPTVKQAQKPSITKLSQPPIRGSDAFSVRFRDEVDKEAMEAFKPNNGPQEQPPKVYDEVDAAKSGPPLTDNERQHYNKLKAYAEGGMISGLVPMSKAEQTQEPAIPMRKKDDMRPPEDEYMAGHFAEGGEVEMDHEDSIAAAIMARRDREKKMASGSKDEDKAEMYADGGMVDIDENAEEQPNMYYRRNQEALKENYDSDMDDVSQPMDSNLKGDEEEKDSENKLDMISSIRSKMNKDRQFKVR